MTQTEDWVKIRGDQLVARDGCVRRPDHRGAVGDALLRSRLAAGRRSPRRSGRVRRRAICAGGAGAGRARDERRRGRSPALGRAGPRRHGPRRAAGWPVPGDVRARAYQGIAQDHFVEVELGDGRWPRDRPLWLVANGWIYPTDSSINVAIGQAGIAPRGLSLEAQDADGSMDRGRARPGISGGQEQDDPDRPRRASRGRALRTRSGCGCGRTSRSTGTRWPSPTALERRRSQTRPAAAGIVRSCAIAVFRRRTTRRRRRARDAALRRSWPTSASAGAIWSATTRASATSASCWQRSTIGTSS